MFWLRNHDRRAFQARGVFGQLIHVDRDNSIVMVKLSSWPEFISSKRKKTTFAAIDAITAVLTAKHNAPAL